MPWDDLSERMAQITHREESNVPKTEGQCIKGSCKRDATPGDALCPRCRFVYRPTCAACGRSLTERTIDRGICGYCGRHMEVPRLQRLSELYQHRRAVAIYEIIVEDRQRRRAGDPRAKVRP